MEQIDSRIIELMASRLCHEFVGPAGAVANGLELVEDTGGDLAEEAMEMVGASAKELTARIKFYRIAYGVGGISSNNLAELRGLSFAFVGEGHSRFSWPMPPIAPRLEDGEGKLVLNMIALAKSALPRGGDVNVDIDGKELVVRAIGEGAGLPDDLVCTMTTKVEFEVLTPRNIHGFWAALLARRVQRKLDYKLINAEEVIIKA